MKQSIYIIMFLVFPLLMFSQNINKKTLEKYGWWVNAEYPYEVFTKDTLKLSAVKSFAPCTVNSPPMFGFYKEQSFNLMYDGLVDTEKDNMKDFFVLNKNIWTYTKKTKEFIFLIYSPKKNNKGDYTDDLELLNKYNYTVLNASDTSIVLAKQKSGPLKQ